MLKIESHLKELGFLPKRIKLNGAKNRCATVYQPHKKNGWFIVNEDAVNYGDWADHIEKGYFWLNDNRKISMSLEKRHKQEKLFMEMAEKDRKERILNSGIAYANCRETLILHPYLTKKLSLNRPDFKYDYQNRLVIPIYEISGVITGYQYINDDGNKLFKSGSVIEKSFYAIKHTPLRECDVYIFCEGYATGSSIWQALNDYYDSINFAVICCMNATNVDKVFQEFKNKFNKKNSMFVIKDTDKAGLSVKSPGFAVHYLTGGDANDIHLEFGLEKLTELIGDGIRELNAH